MTRNRRKVAEGVCMVLDDRGPSSSSLHPQKFSMHQLRGLSPGKLGCVPRVAALPHSTASLVLRPTTPLVSSLS